MRKNNIIPIIIFFMLLITGCSSKDNVGDVSNLVEDANDKDAFVENNDENNDENAEVDSDNGTNPQDDGANHIIESVFRDDLSDLFEGLELNKSYKPIGNGNPLITQGFGADPYGMVYKDKVYVYMTQDEVMYDSQGKVKDNDYSNINKLRCISSADMVNWTDHGYIHIGGIKGVSFWAKRSWAPTAAWKEIDGEDKFFLYFSNGAGGIGVLTADSPTGPFKDLGEALITHDTPNCRDVVWLFDPAVLVDDDGTAYLYFGGGVPEEESESPKTARVIQLGDDMVSVVGEAVVIDAPFMFENSGINKIGDTYYYTYCSNFRSRAGAKGPHVPNGGEIIYMTSDNPMGPWQYQGSILKNPHHYFGTGGNNHHSIVQFNDKWYIFYHTSILQDAMGIKGGYRSTNVNEVTINDDGSIDMIKADRLGVAQLKPLNPYEEIMATTMANNAGIKMVEEEKKTFRDPLIVSVGEIESGDWIQVSGVDFGDVGPDTLTISYSSQGGSGAIRVCSDTLDGQVITYIEVKDTGSFTNYVNVTVPVNHINGVHDIYFEFVGSDYHINSWQFNKNIK
ncbi:MAG: family 43 glycosylhydrolase [Clostridiales bacterium]|nr:family 43 glycosylhydrolase [Clostridiales bacterium]